LIRRIPAAQVPERLKFKEIGEQDPETGNLKQMQQPAPAWLQKLIEEDAPRNQKAAQLLKERAQALERAPAGGRKAVDVASNEYAKSFMSQREGVFEGLPDPIMLHDLDPQAWRQHMQGPMQGVMDYLSQNYTPEQLEKISVPDAWRGSQTWHEVLAKKKVEALKDPFAGTLPHKEYPSGYKWVKFDPESSVLEEALKGEGNVMGHCVGGYCDDVRNQSSHIYSLRDPKGKAHVTVEVNPQQNPESARLNKGMGPQGFDISQIKGKADKKPAAQYLPYVQDFVRSGKWGDVGDLQNTGLKALTTPSGKLHLVTPAEHAQLVKNFGSSIGVRGETRLSNELPEDWQPGPIPRMAEGGEVPRIEITPKSGGKPMSREDEEKMNRSIQRVPERPAPRFTVDQIPNVKDTIKPTMITMAEGGEVLEQADHEDALAYLQELLGDHAQA